MTTFSLSQKWVSKITMSDKQDVPVIGAVQIPAPSRDELTSILEEFARTEAVREMSRRKWIQPPVAALKDRVATRGAALLEFMTANRAVAPAYAMFKGRRPIAKQALLDEFITRAWVGHLTNIARAQNMRTIFQASSIDRDFLKSLAQLSTLEDGPALALQAVRERGICVILESALPGMTVDGASFHVVGSAPVIALTARHDRLDNFWFTLFHELGHVALHLRDPGNAIFVDAEEDAGSDEAETEAEANAFAKDNLIPRDIWFRSDAYRFGSESSVLSLAKQLGIHPAIVAGRIRYERHDFRIFNELIGRGRVREVVFGV